MQTDPSSWPTIRWEGGGVAKGWLLAIVPNEKKIGARCDNIWGKCQARLEGTIRNHERVGSCGGRTGGGGFVTRNLCV